MVTRVAEVHNIHSRLLLNTIPRPAYRALNNDAHQHVTGTTTSNATCGNVSSNDHSSQSSSFNVRPEV